MAIQGEILALDLNMKAIKLSSLHNGKKMEAGFILDNNLSPDGFNVGDLVVFNYKGGILTDLKHKPVGQSFPPKRMGNGSPPNEKKIIRQSCLKAAVQIWVNNTTIIIGKENKFSEAGDIFKNSTVVSQAAMSQVLTVAEQFEKWVNRD